MLIPKIITKGDIVQMQHIRNATDTLKLGRLLNPKVTFRILICLLASEIVSLFVP